MNRYPIPVSNPSVPFAFCTDCPFRYSGEDAFEWGRMHYRNTKHTVHVDFYPALLGIDKESDTNDTPTPASNP